MNALGDLSYPIYLVHTLVLILFGQWLLSGALSLEWLDMLDRGYASLVAFSAATVLAAVLVHRLVEIPMALGDEDRPARLEGEVGLERRGR